MSLFNCHRQEPQPWMSYIAQNMITYSGECCPALVTNLTGLLPFQIISAGDFVRAEIRPYGDVAWTEVSLSITTIFTEGLFIHSFAGGATDYDLSCGVYEFRVIAGETWWFEPFTVDDFEITTVTYSIRDDFMLPLKFGEQQPGGIPLIASCDSLLPFMFSTDHATTGDVHIYLHDANCDPVELEDVVISVMTINNKTYYIHEGHCLSTFLTCGVYKLEIEDGEYSYWSAWFTVECDINDVPDGYRALTDINGCVMRDEEGNVLYDVCDDGDLVTVDSTLITVDDTTITIDML